MSTVSVIIPNYNYERYLLQRLTSILTQTYRDIDVIFLDDCSCDNSVDAAENILAKAEFPYTIIRNEQNSGSPFKQWNKGIQQAQGEFIWIAEADDFCEPDFLEILIKSIRQSKDIGIAYCQTCPVDHAGKTIASFDYVQYTNMLDTQKWLSEYINNGRNEVQNYLSRLCTIINVSSVLFRKEAFLKAGYVDTSYKQAGDWLTYIKILAHSDIAYTPKKLNYHRLHPSKSTSNTVTNLIYFKDMLKVFQYTHTYFDISEQIKELQFQHILRQWNEHYNGPYGRITKINNFILLFTLLSFYPKRAKALFHQYMKTFSA